MNRNGLFSGPEGGWKKKILEDLLSIGQSTSKNPPSGIALVKISRGISIGEGVGTFSTDEKGEQYSRRLYNANEKGCRVLRDNLVRSFENRNVDLGKYGGGVKCMDNIYATSGFTEEKKDEAIALIWGFIEQFNDLRPSDQTEDLFEFIAERLQEEVRNNFSDNEEIVPMFSALLKKQGIPISSQ